MSWVPVDTSSRWATVPGSANAVATPIAPVTAWDACARWGVK